MRGVERLSCSLKTVHTIPSLIRPKKTRKHLKHHRKISHTGEGVQHILLDGGVPQVDLHERDGSHLGGDDVGGGHYSGLQVPGGQF